MFKSEYQQEIDRLYPSGRDCYEGKIEINSVEYDAHIEYAYAWDDTAPTVCMDAIRIEPVYGMVVDLKDDSYGWLLGEEDILDLEYEIEGHLIQEKNRGAYGR